MHAALGTSKSADLAMRLDQLDEQPGYLIEHDNELRVISRDGVAGHARVDRVRWTLHNSNAPVRSDGFHPVGSVVIAACEDNPDESPRTMR
jgi:hypothetical protein